MLKNHRKMTVSHGWQSIGFLTPLFFPHRYNPICPIQKTRAKTTNTNPNRHSKLIETFHSLFIVISPSNLLFSFQGIIKRSSRVAPYRNLNALWIIVKARGVPNLRQGVSHLVNTLKIQIKKFLDLWVNTE